MKTIVLQPLVHKNSSQIGIFFPYDLSTKDYIKKFPGVKWSQTHRVFYVKDNSANRQQLFQYLTAERYYVDYSALKKQHKPKSPSKNSVSITLPELLESQKLEIEKFKKWMAQKRLSTNTINTYSGVTLLFLRYQNLKKHQEITTKLIEAFNYDFIVAPGKSINYQNQCINGIKKYLMYKGNVVEHLEIERPRKA
ncbi:MAG TPA: recombinase, partial [Flavobacteriaceae bacterium]|nr:recombinase [Flavobacteriaceae bacterium]